MYTFVWLYINIRTTDMRDKDMRNTDIYADKDIYLDGKNHIRAKGDQFR